MRVESLERLSAAVAEWRREKKHKGEKMPEELLGRVRLAAREQGVNAIEGSTRVDRRRRSYRLSGNSVGEIDGNLLHLFDFIGASGSRAVNRDHMFCNRLRIAQPTNCTFSLFANSRTSLFKLNPSVAD